jgi:hypothetical protein
MRKTLLLFSLFGTLMACNNSSENTDDKVDSIENRKDTLMENVDSVEKAKVDSIKQWKENQEEKIDSATEARKDSLKGKS